MIRGQQNKANLLIFNIVYNQCSQNPITGVHTTKNNNQLVRLLFDTRPSFMERLQKLALPTKRSFEVTLQHGTRAQVQLLLPPSWREELRDAAFPVLVEV